MIEFDRNPNALRDEILVDHSWALGEDGALAVPMNRWALIVVYFLAVQDSSITDIVCLSVGRSEPTKNGHYTAHRTVVRSVSSNQ